MPVPATIPFILPAASLQRLKTLEDRITYKYSQDRIDQGLDQDGNDIDDPSSSYTSVDDDAQDDQVNMQWLLKVLVKLEETAPPEEEEEEQELEDGTKVVKALKETQAQVDYRLQHEILTERVSSCVAHFCGRAASGAMTRTWTFKTVPPQSLRIHDPSFTGGDVGFKTFGSAYLLSKHIAHGDIPQLQPWTSTTTATTLLPSPPPKILELGSGTGLVGFAAALFSYPKGPKVILSDYHPNVLSTLEHNRQLNHLEGRCEIQLLDWRDILTKRKQRWNAWQSLDPERPLPLAAKAVSTYVTEKVANSSYTTPPAAAAAASSSDNHTEDKNSAFTEPNEQSRMDLILGAEVVYDHGHAELVAHVVDELLKREWIVPPSISNPQGERPAFHIMFPIRATHADVIADFDFWMDRMGLVDGRQAKEWGREDGETKFLYHWREYVRREHLHVQ